MKVSAKKIALMAASCVLMVLSSVVDSKLSEDDLREMVKEEVANAQNENNRREP